MDGSIIVLKKIATFDFDLIVLMIIQFKLLLL